MEVKEQIKSFIEDNFIIDDDAVEFTYEDNIFAKGFVNSLFAMKLVSFLEREFEIEIDNDDLDISNFSSVDNIINFIDRKK